MRRAMRLLVASCLLMAIPLQGFAAASMVFCGPHHASLAQRADSDHHHDHGAQTAHHHHDAASGPDTDETGLEDFLKFFSVKCSACASCCSLAAMPIAPLPAVTFVPSIGVAVPFFGSSYAGIVPDGLERPPSQHLA